MLKGRFVIVLGILILNSNINVAAESEDDASVAARGFIGRGMSNNIGYFGLYGLKMAATLRDNLINTIGYLTHQPKKILSSEVHLTLRDIQAQLKLNKIDTFNLIPLLPHLVGKDFSYQFLAVIESISRQQSAQLRCEYVCENLLRQMRAELGDLLPIFGGIRYNPLLVGVEITTKNIKKIKQIANTVINMQIGSLTPNDSNMIYAIGLNLFKFMKELTAYKTELTPNLLSYLMTFFSWPVDDADLQNAVATVEKFLRRADDLALEQHVAMLVFKFVQNNPMETVHPHTLLDQTLDFLINNDYLSSVIRNAAIVVKRALVSRVIGKEFVNVGGHSIELEDLGTMLQIIDRKDYPLEIILANKRLQSYLSTVGSFINVGDFKPYLYKTRQESLVALLDYILEENQFLTPNIEDGINAIKSYLLFQLKVSRIIDADLFLVVLNAFLAPDLNDDIREQTKSARSYVLSHFDDLNVILTAAPQQTCMDVISCYIQILTTIRKHPDGARLNLAVMEMPKCIQNRFMINQCAAENVYYPPDLKKLLGTIGYDDYPRETVMAAVRIRDYLITYGQTMLNRNVKQYCTKHETLLAYLKEMVTSYYIPQEIKDSASYIIPHLEFFTSPVALIDVNFILVIMESFKAPDVTAMFLDQLENMRAFMQVHEETLNTLLLAMPAEQCTDLITCYNRIVAYLNEKNVGFIFPEFVTVSPAWSDNRPLTVDALLDAITSVAQYQDENLITAQCYMKRHENAINAVLPYVERCRDVVGCFQNILAAIKRNPGAKLNMHILEYIFSPTTCGRNYCMWIPEQQNAGLNPTTEYIIYLIEQAQNEKLPLIIRADLDQILTYLQSTNLNNVVNAFKSNDHKCYSLVEFLKLVQRGAIMSADNTVNFINVCNYFEHGVIPKQIQLNQIISIVKILYLFNGDERINQEINLIIDELVEHPEKVNAVLKQIQVDCTTSNKCYVSLLVGLQTLNWADNWITALLIKLLRPPSCTLVTCPWLNSPVPSGSVDIVTLINAIQAQNYPVEIKLALETIKQFVTSINVSSILQHYRPKIYETDEQRLYQMLVLLLNTLMGLPEEVRQAIYPVCSYLYFKNSGTITIDVDVLKLLIRAFQAPNLHESIRLQMKELEQMINTHAQLIEQQLIGIKIPCNDVLECYAQVQNILTQIGINIDIIVLPDSCYQYKCPTEQSGGGLVPQEHIESITFPPVEEVPDGSDNFNPQVNQPNIIILQVPDQFGVLRPILLDISKPEVSKAIWQISQQGIGHPSVAILLPGPDDILNKCVIDIQHPEVIAALIRVGEYGHNGWITFDVENLFDTVIYLPDQTGGSIPVRFDFADNPTLATIKNISLIHQAHHGKGIVIDFIISGNHYPIDITNKDIIHTLIQCSVDEIHIGGVQNPIIYFPDNSGNMRPLEIDIRNPEICDILKQMSLQSLSSGQSIIIYDVITGNLIPLNIDVTTETWKGFLTILQQIPPPQLDVDKNPSLTILLPNQFGEVSPIYIDIQSDDILRAILSISQQHNGPPLFNVVVDGKVISICVDPYDEEIIAILEGQLTQTESQQENSLITIFVTNYEGESRLVPIDFENDHIIKILETLPSCNASVIEKIEQDKQPPQLGDALQIDANTIVIYINDEHENLKAVVLDTTNYNIVYELIIAEESGNTPSAMQQQDSLLIAFVLDDLQGGSIPIILDINNPEVMKELYRISNSVDSSQPVTIINIVDGNGNTFPVRLNIQNPDIIKILIHLATLTPVCNMPFEGPYINDMNPILAFTVGYNGITVPIILDTNNPDVINTLLALSPYCGYLGTIINIQDKFGRNLPICLDLMLENVLQELIRLTKLTPVNILPFCPVSNNEHEPKVVIPIGPDANENIVIDIADGKNIPELISISEQTIDNGQLTTIYVRDTNGAVIPISMDLTDGDTIRRLQELGQSKTSKPIVVTEVNGKTPLLTLTVDEENGNSKSITLDLSQPGVIETLIQITEISTIVGNNNPTTIQILKANGQVVTLLLDLTDENVISRLIAMSELSPVQIITVQEIVPPGGNLPLITIKVTDDAGISYHITLDPNDPATKSQLEQITLESQNSTTNVVVEVVGDNGETFSITIDTANGNVIGQLINMGEQAVVQVMPVENKRPIVAVKVPDECGRLVTVYIDTNNYMLCQKLLDIAGQTGTMIRLPDINGVLTQVYIDLTNSDICNELITILNPGRVDCRPTVIIPEGGTQPLILIQFVDINGDKVSVTLDVNNRNVVQTLIDMSESVPPGVPVTIVPIQDEGGNVIPIRLDLNNPEVIRILNKIKDKTPVKVPVIQVITPGRTKPLLILEVTDIYGNVVPIMLDTESANVIATLKQLSESAKNVPCITIMVEEGGILIPIRLNTRDEKVIYILEQLQGHTNIKVVTPEGLNSLIIIATDQGGSIIIDTNELDIIHQLIQISEQTPPNVPCTVFIVTDENGKNIPIRLDLKNPTVIATIEQISKKSPIRIRPIPITPSGGKYPLTVVYVTDISGHITAVTLNLNVFNVFKKLVELSESRNINARITLLPILDINGNIITFKLDLTNPHTIATLIELARNSVVTVSPDVIYLPNGKTPLLIFEIMQINGKPITVTLNTEDIDVINTLINISEGGPSATNTIIHVTDENGNIVPVYIDFTKPQIIQVLQELSKKCLIQVIPIPGQNSLIIFSPEQTGHNSPLTLNLNEQEIVSSIRIIAQEITDNRPVIIIDVQDNFGNVFPLRIDIRDPEIIKILKDYQKKSPIKVLPVKVIPGGGKNPIVVIQTISSTGSPITVSLDVNDINVLQILQQISQTIPPGIPCTILQVIDTDGSIIVIRLDLENGNVVEQLLDLSEYCPVQIYPTEILPPGGRFPIVTMKVMDDNGILHTITLDINNPSVVQQLRLLEQKVGHVGTTIQLVDSVGNVFIMKIDITNPETIAILKQVSGQTPVRIYPVIKLLPLLEIDVLGPHGTITTITIDLNSENALAQIMQLSAEPTLGPVTVVEVIDVFGNVVSIKLDLQNPGFIKKLQKIQRRSPIQVSPIKVTVRGSNIPLLSVLVIDNYGNVLTLTLDPSNPEVSHTLKEISESLPGNVGVSMIYMPDVNGNLIPIKLDLKNPDIIRKLQILSKLCPVQVLPVQIVPPDGIQPLIVIQYAHPNGETYTFTIDPNDLNAIKALHEISTQGVGTPTISLPVVDSSGNVLILRLDLLNIHVLNHLNEISQQCPVIVQPLPVRAPYVTITILDDYGNRKPITLDLNQLGVRAVLEQLNDESAALPLVVTISNADGTVVPVRINLNNPNVVASLKHISRILPAQSVTVYPVQGNSPLVSHGISDSSGGVTSVTLDVNNPLQVSMLDQVTQGLVGKPATIIQVDNKDGSTTVIKLDPFNPQAALKASELSPIQLYPVKIIPPNARWPLVTIQYVDYTGQPKSFTLDLNRPEVLQKLQEFGSTSLPATLILLRDHVGTVLPVNLDLLQPHVIKTLENLSWLSPCRLKPQGGKLPLLEIKIPKLVLPITVNLNDQQVVAALENLPPGNGPSYIIEVIDATGRYVPIIVDVSMPEVRQTLRRWSIPATQTQSIIKFEVTDQLGTNIPITLDITNSEIIRELKMLSDTCPAHVDADILDIWTSGGLLSIRLDLQNPDTITVLQKLTFLTLNPPPIASQPITFLEFDVTDVYGNVIRIRLAINNPEVMRRLLELSDAFQVGAPETVLPVDDGHRVISIRLDLTNQNTIRVLIELTAISTGQPIPLPPPTPPPTPPPVSTIRPPETLPPGQQFIQIDIPNEATGTTTFILDVNIPEVIGILVDLTNGIPPGAGYLLVEIPLKDGSTLPIKLDPSNPDTYYQLSICAQLSQYPDVRPPPHSLISFFIPDGTGGQIEIILDLNNPQVRQSLKELSSHGGQYVINIEDFGGNTIPIRLDLNNPRVREILLTLAQISTSASQTPIGGTLHLVTMSVPDQYSGSTTITLNTDDVGVVQVLKQLNTNSVPGNRGVDLKIIENGQEIPIKLDTANPQVVATLKLVSIPTVGFIPETIVPTATVIFLNNNNQITPIVLDLQKPYHIVQCLELANANAPGPSPTYLLVQDDNGGTIPIGLDLNNPLVVQKLIQITGPTNNLISVDARRTAFLTMYLPIYGEYRPTKIRLDAETIRQLRNIPNSAFQQPTVLKIFDDVGRDTDIYMDLTNPDVVNALLNIQNYIDPVQVNVNRYLVLYLNVNWEPRPFYFDVHDPNTVAVFESISNSYRQGVPLTLVRVIPPHGQPEIIPLDITNQHVINHLTQVSLTNTDHSIIQLVSGAPTMTIQIPTPDGQVMIITLDVKNERTLEELIDISNSFLLGSMQMVFDVSDKYGRPISISIDPTNEETIRRLKALDINGGGGLIRTLTDEEQVAELVHDFINNDVPAELLEQKPTAFIIPNEDGGIESINVDLRDPNVVEELRRIRGELGDGGVSIEIDFGDYSMPLSFDQNNSKMVSFLEGISSDDVVPQQYVLVIPDEHGFVSPILLETGNNNLANLLNTVKQTPEGSIHLNLGSHAFNFDQKSQTLNKLKTLSLAKGDGLRLDESVVGLNTIADKVFTGKEFARMQDLLDDIQQTDPSKENFRRQIEHVLNEDIGKLSLFNLNGKERDFPLETVKTYDKYDLIDTLYTGLDESPNNMLTIGDESDIYKYQIGLEVNHGIKPLVRLLKSKLAESKLFFTKDDENKMVPLLIDTNSDEDVAKLAVLLISYLSGEGEKFIYLENEDGDMEKISTKILQYTINTSGVRNKKLIVLVDQAAVDGLQKKGGGEQKKLGLTDEEFDVYRAWEELSKVSDKLPIYTKNGQTFSPVNTRSKITKLLRSLAMGNNVLIYLKNVQTVMIPAAVSALPELKNLLDNLRENGDKAMDAYTLSTAILQDVESFPGSKLYYVNERIFMNSWRHNAEYNHQYLNGLEKYLLKSSKNKAYIERPDGTFEKVSVADRLSKTGPVKLLVKKKLNTAKSAEIVRLESLLQSYLKSNPSEKLYIENSEEQGITEIVPNLQDEDSLDAIDTIRVGYVFNQPQKLYILSHSGRLVDIAPTNPPALNELIEFLDSRILGTSNKDVEKTRSLLSIYLKKNPDSKVYKKSGNRVGLKRVYGNFYDPKRREEIVEDLMDFLLESPKNYVYFEDKKEAIFKVSLLNKEIGMHQGKAQIKKLRKDEYQRKLQMLRDVYFEDEFQELLNSGTFHEQMTTIKVFVKEYEMTHDIVSTDDEVLLEEFRKYLKPKMDDTDLFENEKFDIYPDKLANFYYMVTLPTPESKEEFLMLPTVKNIFDRQQTMSIIKRIMSHGVVKAADIIRELLSTDNTLTHHEKESLNVYLKLIMKISEKTFLVESSETSVNIHDVMDEVFEFDGLPFENQIEFNLIVDYINDNDDSFLSNWNPKEGSNVDLVNFIFRHLQETDVPGEISEAVENLEEFLPEQQSDVQSRFLMFEEI